MKTSELKKFLRKNGCYLDEQGNKHEWWYSPISGKHFTVPRHDAKEIPKGNLNSILRDAGLT